MIIEGAFAFLLNYSFFFSFKMIKFQLKNFALFKHIRSLFRLVTFRCSYAVVKRRSQREKKVVFQEGPVIGVYAQKTDEDASDDQSNAKVPSPLATKSSRFSNLNCCDAEICECYCEL